MEASDNDGNVQCYAPTNDADPELKDAFCRSGKRSGPSQYLPIVMGDLNALVRTAKMGNERFMERHGYGVLR